MDHGHMMDDMDHGRIIMDDKAPSDLVTARLAGRLWSAYLVNDRSMAPPDSGFSDDLQCRVEELEGELGRSLDDNQTLRHDVIMTQDLLNRTKQELGRKSDETEKLKAKLKRNDETIKQCTESLTSVRSMVNEKNDVIRQLKDKCRRLQRHQKARPLPAASTGSEDDDVTSRRPPRPRRPRHKSTDGKNDDVTDDVTGRPATSDQERLRHHTGSSQSVVHDDRLSPMTGTGSDVIKSPSPVNNIPLTLSDQSESLYETRLSPEVIAPGVEVVPGNEVDRELSRLRTRLIASENMNETLRAELMLYQHLSQTLTSSAGSTPAQSRDVNVNDVTNSSSRNVTRQRLSASPRPASAPKLLSSEPSSRSVNDVNSDVGVGMTSLLPSELTEHLRELRRLRERLEETIALNDDLTKQLNQQLRETGWEDSDGLVQSLSRQVDVLRQDLTDTQLQLHQITADADSYLREMEAAQLENQNLCAQLRKHQQDSEVLREECNTLHLESNALKTECNKLKLDQKTVKEQCNRLESERNRLKEQCSRLNEQNARLESERNRLKDYTDNGSDGRMREATSSGVKVNQNVDLSALVEEISRLREQLERSISTNQALRHKLEEIISKGGSDSLSSSLKKLLRQSETLVHDDVIPERRGDVNEAGVALVDQVYNYPADSSDSGTCTGNRSLSNSHSSLPVHRSHDDVTGREPITREDLSMPRMRRAVSALSLSESGASSRSRGSDVIQHCDVINDDDHILSVSMFDEEPKPLSEYDLDPRDDYLLLPPGGRGSLHGLQASRPRPAMKTRSVDDLRYLSTGHVTGTRLHNRSHPLTGRIDSDLRFLFAIGRLDDYELAKKLLGECQVTLRGVVARVQDRLHTYQGMSLVQSGEYTTLREVSMSVDNSIHCVHKAAGLLYQFWTSQLPPRDHHGNYVDPDMQHENFALRDEVDRLRNKYSHALKTMKSAQKRLQKANRRKEDMEEAIYRQLSQTEKVVRQARINMEMKTGVNAADVLTRRQHDK